MFVQLNMAILPLMATTKYHLTEPIKTKRAKIKRHIKEQGPHLWQKQVFQKKKNCVSRLCTFHYTWNSSFEAVLVWWGCLQVIGSSKMDSQEHAIINNRLGFQEHTIKWYLPENGQQKHLASTTKSNDYKPFIH